MARVWYSLPQLKVEVDSVEISEDSVSVVVTRPENAVSRVRLYANDYQGANYIGNIDTFEIVKVSFRYADETSTWTQVFEGVVEEVGPALTVQKQVVEALAYGYGRAIRNTYSAENFGKESENTALDTPEEIWDDLVDNRINKNFDGVATQYAITKTKIKSVATPTINFISSPYRNNMEIANEVCQIHLAGQAGSAGVHWFVDPNKNWHIDTIGNHTVDTTIWPTYWGGSQALSTLVEGEDFLQYNFKKRATGYANKIILLTDLRKPGYDFWCENQSGLWGVDAFSTVSDEAVEYLVGSYSLEILGTQNQASSAYYPSGDNAGWDFTQIGNEQNVPTVNFYIKKNADVGALISHIGMRMNNTFATDWFYKNFGDQVTNTTEWFHISFPIGPYVQAAVAADKLVKQWDMKAAGSPVWTNITSLDFVVYGTGPAPTIWIDDLHFSGKIIREAYDSADIASKSEHQKIVRLDTSVDDSMVAATDTGTAAQLAYAELLTCMSTPIVGTVSTPGIVDIKPGQLVHVHADKQTSGIHRIDSDFRCKTITHSFTEDGFITSLDLTDDVVNTFAASHADLAGLLSKVTRVDKEAKNLRVSGVSNLTPRLSVDYTP